MSAGNKPGWTVITEWVFILVLLISVFVAAYVLVSPAPVTFTTTQTVTTNTTPYVGTTVFGGGVGEGSIGVGTNLGNNVTWTNESTSNDVYYQTRVTAVAEGENVTVIGFDNSTVYGITTCNTQEFDFIFVNGTQAYSSVKIGDIISVGINVTNTWQQYGNATNITERNYWCHWSIIGWSVVN